MDIKHVLKEYQQKRDLKEIKHKEKIKLLHRTIPRAKEIDTELSTLGIKMMKESYNNPSSAVDLANKMAEVSLDLNMEKVELLIENGFPKDYLEIKYDCEQCSDSGFIENEKCPCLKQKIINISYKKSNLTNSLENENFDNFNFSLYPNDKNPSDKSALDYAKTAFNESLDFTRNFELKFENLLFYGEPGVGKTFLCNSIAKELLDKSKSVVYLTAPNFFKKIENFKFNKVDTDEIRKDPVLEIIDADLLILDDLGSEAPSSFVDSELFNCINTRLLTKKSTVISTNLAPKDLISRYDERIFSRLMSKDYKALKMTGNDIRINY